MDNENTNQTTDQNKATAVGGERKPSFAEALFGPATSPKESKGDEGTAEGAGAPSGDTANLLIGESGDSTEFAGGAGTGEGEEVTEEEFYEFGEQKFTPAQLEEVLRDRETYQRYNMSVKPLIESITDYSTQFERAKALAMTECEKTIGELKRVLASNTLDSRQYQQAHMQLTNAESRMIQLNEAAKQEAELRAKTLNQTRQQNARQAVTTLTKQGWSRDDILQVGGIAQKVIGDKLADVMSPELMQVFRDAAELRRTKEQAAKRLQSKANTALRTTKQQPQKQQPQQPGGKKTWGEMIFGGGE